MNYKLIPSIPSPVQLCVYYLTGKKNRCGINNSFLNLLTDALQRLHTILPHKELKDNTVLLFHDGSYACNQQMAFVRSLQQEMLDLFNQTFFLRIAFINWHPATETLALRLINNNNLSSAFYTNNIEFVTIFNNEVVSFSPTTPIHSQGQELAHDHFIQHIHRNGVDISPIYYDPCDPAFSNRLHKFIYYTKEADVLIIGELPFQFDLYPFHILRNKQGIGFPKKMIFFPLAGDTSLATPSPAHLYEQYLKIVRHALLFDFTELCGSDPALLAHISGLKAEKLEELKYVDGFNRYIGKSYRLLRKTDYSLEFIERIQKHFDNPGTIKCTRKNIERYAQQFYDINKVQLTCMAYQPFINRGNHLNHFLRREYPHLLKKERLIRRILSEGMEGIIGNRYMVKQLENISGLSIKQLQSLYM